MQETEWWIDQIPIYAHSEVQIEHASIYLQPNCSWSPEESKLLFQVKQSYILRYWTDVIRDMVYIGTCTTRETCGCETKTKRISKSSRSSVVTNSHQSYQKTC